MTRTATLVLAFIVLLVALTAPAGAADDVLKTYKKRYKADTFLSEKEDLVKALGETGDPKAVAALEWCADISRDKVEKHRKGADKAYKAWHPVHMKVIEKETAWADNLRKRGKPIPKMRPKFAEDDKSAKLKAALKREERLHAQELKLLDDLLAAMGRLVALLPPPQQTKIQETWKGKTLADKDWLVRARGWEMVAHTDTPWALQMLLSGALDEPDPRVLAKILVGLGGRKPELVLPVFEARLDDTRWLVRAAVISALQATPSKETIDLLLATLGKEEGRLRDDCAVALRALTGADIRTDADLWSRYWTANREKWTGPPVPEEESEDDEPTAHEEQTPEEKKAAEEKAKAGESKKTGFFGIETKSRRLVYVIDVSGSMNEPVGPKSGPTRADAAKEELKRAVLALEDGAMFNIIFFSGGVKPWKKRMVAAESETRVGAVEFIDQTQVVGGTSTFDALKEAFDLASLVTRKKSEPDPSGDAQVDTIILLSDGKPTIGRYTDPEQIRDEVKRWNADRRIAIHTVAFGADADRKFMEGLALDTGGTFLGK